MTRFVSGLYRGVVTHNRFTPKRHRLKYTMFQLLLDIDEIPSLGRKLRFFSYNRLNVFSHHDRDHADGKPAPLRDYVEEILRAGGMPILGGRIQLLCMPRFFGFVFNPLSIYYCYRTNGTLGAILYEVNNTFGQRHSYLIGVDQVDGHSIRQTCEKAFHVSPFMAMEMSYDFAMSEPRESLTTTVTARDASGALVMTAAFAGERVEITDRSLLKALAAHPLLTFKVVTAIHFEAVKLWLKGVRLRPLPPPPSMAVTVVPPKLALALVPAIHKTDKQSA